MDKETKQFREQAYQSAKHEVQILKELSSLHSDFLLSFYGFQTLDKFDSKSFIMQMEYGVCNLRELFELRIKENNLYSFQQASLLAFDLIEGLLAAKSVGICHRDIKTENILFMNVDPFCYKFADWGVSLKLDSNQIGSRSQFGVVGTKK